MMKSSQATIWPPLYTIKKSTRSKQVRLSIHPKTGLTIHLPHSLRRPIDIDALLLEKKSWILKHLDLLEPLPAQKEIALPLSLSLDAIGETWHIDYKSNCAKPTLFAAAGYRLVIMDKEIQVDRALRLLRAWLKRKGETHLVPWLTQLSIQHQLPFNKVQIRNQKTLWGSCSSTQNIQLNYKLLFLPPNLTEHILLHELSHIKYLNHSRSFWQLLSKMDSHCHQHNAALKTIETELPVWLYADHT